MAGCTRCTQAGDWLAVWKLDRRRIRILLVQHSSGAQTALPAPGDSSAPDLAEVRERFPELTRLWDAVRHEFWANAVLEDLPG